jgi:D-aspartate ligase
MRSDEDAPFGAQNPAEGGPEIGAMILGGAHGSLAVARSLGRHGVPVVHVNHDHPIVGLSRYVRRKLHWEGPDAPNALERLLEIGRRERLQGFVLFPGGDPEVRFASKHRAALSEMFRVTTPSWEISRLSDDKRQLYRYAESIGLDCPRSAAPRSRQDLAGLDIRFPLVLKPAGYGKPNALTLAKCWRVEDHEELGRLYEKAAALQGSSGVILQELVSGGGESQFSYAGVWQDGAPIASLVARRLRQLPIDFGFTSTLVETIENATIEAAAEKFLTSLNFSGVVELEYKFDARDGRYKLLDFNNRAWAWIGLAATAGVDMPHLCWRLAIGDRPQPSHARAGAVWMHAARDLLSAAQQAMEGRIKLADYLKCWRRPLAFAAFALDDPLPGIVELPLALYRGLTRRAPAILRTSSVLTEPADAAPKSF